PGTEIEIQLGYRSQNATVFRGIVVRHGVRARPSGSLLLVECKDVAVRLTQGAKSAYFVDKKDSEIIEEVLQARGLDSDVADTGVSLEAVVQVESTDWDFILCRAEANGRLVGVVDGTVTVKAPDAEAEPALSVGFGSTLLELDVEMDARVQDESLTART